MDGVIQMNEIKIKLQFLIPSLPRAEKIVAEYMLSHAEQISDMTIAMLSEESKASEATISRFCKRLGYSSFVQLKQDFAKSEIEAEDEHNPKPVSANDSLVDIFDKVVQGILRSLNNTRTFFTKDYDRALEAIIGARAVYFFATGDSQANCLLASFKFNRVGIPTYVYTDVIFQYETAMRLTKEDVVIAISSSGRSINVVKAARLAHEKGAVTISITQTGNVPLTKCSDINIFISVVDTTIGRDSVAKRAAELAIIEMFYLGIIARGPLDYETMLQNTMMSSDMNK
ncbi:MurR/RpiR family transcriptional regulator [Candidatus Merdisoma sp. JLR.KK011]|uniref:MurR/RpiR family transcriptional regulator n=1 Tax=Candidatus Merdisoma sp. JLR.KK011 TaxID=3114299 RepID=UPI002FF39813